MILTLLFALLLMALPVVGLVWMIRRQFRAGEEDKLVILLRWAITLFIGGLAIMAFPWFHIFGLFLIVFCGVVFSVLWAPSIGAWLAGPIASAFDGGNVAPERKPQLSIAEGHRKRGEYQQAVVALKLQLNDFPEDFETRMLLAGVLIENLGDFESGRLHVARVANNAAHPPRLRSFALTQMADWELQYARDPLAARQCFERLRELLPGTEFAVAAAQRIAHLPESIEQAPAGAPVRPKLRVGESSGTDADAVLHGPHAEGDRLQAQLDTHPLDAEARERLAALLADDLGAPDLAAMHLEILIGQSGRQPRMVARWLNQLADVQLHRQGNVDAARATLCRLIERFPGSALAEQAERRIDCLSVETSSKKTSRTVKLGSYEDDLGLKGTPGAS
jgi:outer membrane protein assembly factor BamD (BamD/ComL family)